MVARNLHIRVISATDLKNVRLLTEWTGSNMAPYAVVSISGGHHAEQQTHSDEAGGINPTWNFPVQFIINEYAAQQNLVFRLRCPRSFNRVGDIGEVSVPVAELLSGIENENPTFQVVTRHVLRPISRRPQGRLNFSYRFGEIANFGARLPPQLPVQGYPAQPVQPRYGQQISQVAPQAGEFSGVFRRPWERAFVGHEVNNAFNDAAPNYNNEVYDYGYDNTMGGDY